MSIDRIPMDDGDNILKASQFLATVSFHSNLLCPMQASPKPLSLVNLLHDYSYQYLCGQNGSRGIEGKYAGEGTKTGQERCRASQYMGYFHGLTNTSKLPVF
jgi:hypothetical protein